jgi:arsenite methyltransferase
VPAFEDDEVKQKLGAAKFFSATYRLFKLAGLETACEDYGQAVTYEGTLDCSRKAIIAARTTR